MQSDVPRVTVIIPLYNSAKTLQRAVNSVQGQSLRDFELLIVDDGSTDASLALAQRFAADDGRIRVIALPENRGKPHAMNRAIREAEGAWIAVLDADDWYEPDRLDIMVAAGTFHDVKMVADNQYFHDAGANVTVRTAFMQDHGDRMLTRESFIAGADPYESFNFGMLKPMVRADFVRQTGLAYHENARLAEDFLYLVEFLANDGTGIVLARPLYNWTQSFGSVSREWTTTGAGRWRYDFKSAAVSNGDVMHQLRRRGEHALAALLARRESAYRKLFHMSEISRKYAEAPTTAGMVRAVAQHPAAWPQLAKRAIKAVRFGRGA